MLKSIKRYVLITLLTASLVPLFAFGTIFFTQTYSILVQKDIENIKFTLDREKKHIEDFIRVNINDMSIIALSGDLKGQDKDDIIGIFTRFMNARKDFDKIKYIYPDGEIIEVTRSEGGKIYKKDPLSVIDIFCLKNGEFAMYSGKEDSGEFIIYSSPVIINGINMGVVTGYMPISNINFLSIDKSSNNLGRIYIKDSRDRYVTSINDDIMKEKDDIGIPIENTDWNIYADIDRVRFGLSTLKTILANIIIFFVLVIVAIIPIAIYIAENLTKPMDELVSCIKSRTKIGGRSPAFYNIQEAAELKSSFNNMIDMMENNKAEFEERVYVDKLTGIYNQRFIEERLGDRIHSLDNNKIYFLMLGINTINDSKIGFQSGILDVALSEIGSIVRNGIRFMDIPTRYSQREFLIILTDVDREKALKIADNMTKEIEKHKFEARGAEVRLEGQFGIAEYRGNIGKAIDESSRELSNKRKIPKA